MGNLKVSNPICTPRAASELGVNRYRRPGDLAVAGDLQMDLKGPGVVCQMADNPTGDGDE